MADYGDKPKNAQTGFLDELVAGIQDAVVSAQRMAEKQHIEMVDLYFDDDTGEPLTMDLTIPSAHPDRVTEELKVPLICLTPLSSIKIDTLKMNLKVGMGKSMPGAKSGIGGQIQQEGTLQAPPMSIDMEATDPDKMAEIEIIFKGSEPPEGLMRINDNLVKTIMSKQIEEKTDE